MANTIALQTAMATALDEKLVAECKTGWMVGNGAGKVQYTGANTFKLARITTDDIAEYSRANGYTGGAVTVEYDPYKMKYDWGRSFMLDAMDVDETNYLAEATSVLNTFVNTKVVPKLDQIRMQELAHGAAAANKKTATLTKANVYEEILKGLDAVLAGTGRTGSDCIIHISHTTYGLLTRSSEITKQLQLQATGVGVSNEITSINGAELVVMPDDRMKDDKKDIYFIVADKSAPIAVEKHRDVKITEPAANPDADAYKIGYRLYHTVIVPVNQAGLVYVNGAAGVGTDPEDDEDE